MATQCVVIYYGPYESFHNVSYKPQKLAGLKDRLQKLGFRVQLVPVKFENYCLLMIGGYEVFRCNIKHLMFNTPYYHDVVCQRAVEAVLEGSKKLLRARNYLWFWTLLQDNAFIHGQYRLKDHHVAKSESEVRSSLPRVEDCMKCCGIVAEIKKN